MDRKKGTPEPPPVPETVYLYDCSQEMVDIMYRAFNYIQKKSSKKKPNEVEEKDVPVLIRSLGLNPNDQHIERVILMARDDEDPKHCTRGHLDFTNVQKKVATVIATDPSLAYRHTENELIGALRAISAPGQDYIEPKDLYDIMTGYGVSFTDEEAQGMIRTGKDRDTGKVWHEDYASILANDSVPKPPEIIATEVRPPEEEPPPPPPPPPAE